VTFVLDASVSLGWFFPDERDQYSQSILTRLQAEPAIVSSVWPLEFTNGLYKAEKRGRLTEADIIRISATITGLPIAVHEMSLATALGPVLALARSEGLTTYDASYLELAISEGLPLATGDGPLRTAAERVGVALAE
jgi:predicted nucleic acid-binding protein